MKNKIISEGSPAPDFCLKDAGEKEVCLNDFAKKTIVLYFYPKDNTPGCSLEAMDFSFLKPDFEKKNAVIFGISKDSCESHQKFIDKKGLTIRLLSDPEAEVQKKYGVWRPKKFMGREFLGTVRTTFILKGGKVARMWDPVKVKGHAQEVLDSI
jgi:thioredoxin-dependent peroxiredoxin